MYAANGSITIHFVGASGVVHFRQTSRAMYGHAAVSTRLHSTSLMSGAVRLQEMLPLRMMLQAAASVVAAAVAAVLMRCCYYCVGRCVQKVMQLLCPYVL